MMLKGTNKLVLNPEAMRLMLEDAINASMHDGEDFVHVVQVEYSSYYNEFVISITTDLPKMEVSDVES